MADGSTLLPPRYRDPQRIARGGMGEIYHATDERLGREVAIKVLAGGYAEDESVRSRFTREALAAARLSADPNTVTIFDVGEWEDRPFIVMEYMPGGSLEETVRSEGAQRPRRVLEWLGQAATALDAAHRAGVIHRDVKPANLMLDAGGNLHVGDFGIASAAGMDSLTQPGTVLGTAGYLAPEQALGEQTTAATDLYALGVVAFELLTGSRPFASDSATAEAAAHVNAPVPSISERRPDLPAELDAVFARVLAKEPPDRYRSNAEFVAALRGALGTAAVTTRAPAPTRAPTRYTARPKRRVRPLLLVAAAVVALGGIALGAAVADGDGDGETASTEPGVKTVVQTRPGTTVEVTVTAEPPPPPAPEPPPPPAPEPPPPPPAAGGAELNDQGFQLMQAGDFAGALPLLEQSVAALQGSGELVEAYASYNLAVTRLALESCDGVEELLDRSEEVQGERREISRARREARRACD